MNQKEDTFLSRFASGLMTLFFRLLYHPLAGSYDLVAATVSLGRWKGWVKESLSLLAGPRVLELGFGPGHMQTYLEKAGFRSYGLDESRQMVRQARGRLARLGQSPRLARGVAQRLPFAGETFDSVVATFPTPYITHPETLSEIQRVLVPRGRLVVLMTAWITGQSPSERFMRWVFTVTGESPPENIEIAKIIKPYTEAGFEASVRFKELPGSRLMFILAKRT